ncbi:GNAT family N-acetyltransferase [Oscillospiraceae bacterium LTW-04]|nr:GNAT family N-acetyltransferase [Oscillospiraceae bacterium MB24-C1]
MEFRKAVPSETSEVFKIYREAIIRMQASGIDQWDDIYPTQAVIEQDIANGEMTIGLMDGIIACAFVLNDEQWEGYEGGNWLYSSLCFSVLHRLCVNPIYQGKGVAKQAIQYIETLLKSEGVDVLRLDSFPKNSNAIKLYEKLDYIKVGETTFRKGLFYLYEKKL